MTYRPGTLTDPNTYEILADRDGFYIATAGGWDLTPTRRFQSFNTVQRELNEWIVEHEAATAGRLDDIEDERGDYR